MAKHRPKNQKLLPSALDFPESELVVGLVGPVGSDLDFVERELRKILRRFEYRVETVKLSEYLRDLDFLETRLRNKPEAVRISTHMDAGNEARRKTGQREFLALHAITDLYMRRRVRVGDEPKARPRMAYIVRSLKTPEEDEARSVDSSKRVHLEMIAATVLHAGWTRASERGKRRTR